MVPVSPRIGRLGPAPPERHDGQGQGDDQPDADRDAREEDVLPDGMQDRARMAADPVTSRSTVARTRAAATGSSQARPLTLVRLWRNTQLRWSGMIRLESVTKRFADGQVAVDDLSLEVAEGELCVLIGPSGCGKTTTMKMINRLVEPTSGRIYLNGEDVTHGDPVKLRRRIGYVIQQVGLFPHLTIADNVGHGAPPARLGPQADRDPGPRTARTRRPRPRPVRLPLSERTVGGPAAARRRGPGLGRRSPGAA